jgi:hypothetical protein
MIFDSCGFPPAKFAMQKKGAKGEIFRSKNAIRTRPFDAIELSKLKTALLSPCNVMAQIK